MINRIPAGMCLALSVVCLVICCSAVQGTPTATPSLAPTATPTQTPTQVPTPYVVSVDMPNKFKPAGRNTNVGVTYRTVGGVLYTVEYTNDYDVPSWQVLQSNIPGINGNVTTTDATVGAVGGAVTERYYRVREQTSNGLSPNVAGFVRFSTCATNAQSWLAGLPIQPYNTAISDVAGWQLGGGSGAPNADMISSWKQNAFTNSILIDLGAYDVSDSMYDGLLYNNKTGQVSTDTLSYSEGFWITSRHNTQVMYVEGEVPDAARVEPVLPNAGSWDMLGYPYPDGQPMNTGGIDGLNYDASGGVNGGNYVQADALYLRACGAGYRIMWLSMTGGWWHEGVGVSAETLDSTEGYWINRGTLASGGFMWNVPKPYAYP